MSEPNLDWGDVPARGSDANHLADVHDDDATVIDALVSQDAEPPAAAELPAVVQNIPRPKIERPAQVTATFRSLALSPGTVYRIAFANPHRKRIVTFTSITTAIIYASSGSDILNEIPSTGVRVFQSSAQSFESFTNGELHVKTTTSNVTLGIMEEIAIEEGR